jgi:hypothetical protein
MTRVLLLAVGALVLVAVVDAVRGRDAPVERTRPAPAGEAARPVPWETEELAGRLAELGATGVLTYSDPNGCELRALALPRLVAAEAPRASTCRFALSPDRMRILFAGGWRADGRLGFRCGGGVDAVDIVSGGGADLYSLGARCPAAWSPDGRLAVVGEDGEVRAWQFPCGPPTSCSEVVLPNAALGAAVPAAYRQLAAPPRVDEVEVLALAWLSRTKLAATFEARWRFGARAGPEAARDERFLAVFEGGRVLLARPDGGAGFTELVTSPRRGYLAVATERPPGFLLLTSAGRQVALPPLRGSHAIAWSPDERLAAIATRASVYILRPGDAHGPVVRLPLAAGDITWLD